MERPEFVTIGNRETGFPMDLTLTSKRPSNLPGGTISSFEIRVTQFEEGSLDPALFEIPPSFKHVDRIDRNPPPSPSRQQTVDMVCRNRENADLPIPYQIRTRSASARYSFSPDCTLNAAYQASMLRTVAARYSSGA